MDRKAPLLGPDVVIQAYGQRASETPENIGRNGSSANNGDIFKNEDSAKILFERGGCEMKTD